jgi:hypothetical protein
MTPPPPYDLPPLQRTIIVKLLKVLLAEVSPTLQQEATAWTIRGGR